jgi:hypothetical protein
VIDHTNTLSTTGPDSSGSVPRGLTVAGVRSLVLNLEPDATDDQAAEVTATLDALEAAARELRRQWRERMLAWLEANRRDLTIGPVRYYAGKRTTTKVLDRKRTGEALLEAVGGDIDAFCAALSSDAFLVSQLRKALPAEVFAELVEEHVEMNVKTGEPLREVKKIDERFVEVRR